MVIIMNSIERYQKAINSMALDMDYSGEIPSQYCEEFKEAASEILSGEFRTDLPHIKDKLRIIYDYMKVCDDPDKRHRLAVKICDKLVDEIIKHYRTDIEEEVESTYNKKYCEDNRNYSVYNSGELSPHCG